MSIDKKINLNNQSEFLRPVEVAPDEILDENRESGAEAAGEKDKVNQTLETKIRTDGGVLVRDETGKAKIPENARPTNSAELTKLSNDSKRRELLAGMLNQEAKLGEWEKFNDTVLDSSEESKNSELT